MYVHIHMYIYIYIYIDAYIYIYIYIYIDTSRNNKQRFQIAISLKDNVLHLVESKWQHQRAMALVFPVLSLLHDATRSDAQWIVTWHKQDMHVSGAASLCRYTPTLATMV